MVASTEKIVEQILMRKQARRTLTNWAKVCGFVPALHHSYIIEKLEAVVRGEIKRLMIFLPPGSAKSTYTSKLFPPWYLAQFTKTGERRSILGCSHSADLATHFGRFARNLINDHENILGYKLRSDSQAADEWETSHGCEFFCAGVGGRIAGRRADLGLIDDPVGSKEDAFSKTIRDNTWDWYRYDFMRRLKPGAAIIIIQTRWHEDDLSGRLLSSEYGSNPEEWTVVNIPLIARENDVLGRKPGDVLWPDYFDDQLVTDAKQDADVFEALYQQNPIPESGNFFHRDWLLTYTPEQLPKESELFFYIGSDHALGEKQSNDRTCILPVGVDNHDNIYVLPDVFWKKADPIEVDSAIFSLLKRRPVRSWWVSRDHISGSMAPYLRKRMFEERIFVYIDEIASQNRRKRELAQSIRSRMAMGKVFWPGYAQWWPSAKQELLAFDSGKHDDLVDAIACLGMGLDQMFTPGKRKEEDKGVLLPSSGITLKDLRKLSKRRELERSTES